MLRLAGYSATGIDPEAPVGPGYFQAEFERCDLPGPVNAVVACASLHHVADLGEALDLVAAALVPGGTVVVVEWARERFDDATARWCFGRLPTDDGEPGWLRKRCGEWQASGQAWDAYCRSWAEEERLHEGHDILRELDTRFRTQLIGYGPYFFPGLAGVSEADEQAAIDAGQIQANRIHYLGRRTWDRVPGTAQLGRRGADGMEGVPEHERAGNLEEAHDDEPDAEQDGQGGEG
jgi:SAM-dependent methyltransferase